MPNCLSPAGTTGEAGDETVSLEVNAEDRHSEYIQNICICVLGYNQEVNEHRRENARPPSQQLSAEPTRSMVGYVYAATTENEIPDDGA